MDRKRERNRRESGARQGQRVAFRWVTAAYLAGKIILSGQGQHGLSVTGL